MGSTTPNEASAAEACFDHGADRQGVEQEAGSLDRIDWKWRRTGGEIQRPDGFPPNRSVKT